MLSWKHLWTLALIALCVSLASGIVFAQDSWSVGDSTLPEEMSKGDTFDATVTATNDGSTTWNTGYSLDEVIGTTTTAIDRWGVGSVAVAGTVAPDADYDFDFEMIAPPWISIAYDSPIPENKVPTVGTFSADFIMSNGSAFMTQDMASAEVTVLGPAFTDVPSTHWAWAQIQECANTATASSPAIVRGYPAGDYRPAAVVTRDQMAVYIYRAAGLPSPTAVYPDFTDVPTDFWAFKEIEACFAAGVVVGYGDNTYQPTWQVNRAQMAVFVQRAAGFELPDVTEDPFVDVTTGHWAAAQIQACVDNGVVMGYPDNTYKPNLAVGRDQMAVFVWRGFVRDNGDVVLGGLAGTTVPDADPGDVDTAELFLPGDLPYYGWTDTGIDLTVGGVVYVALDAVQVKDGDITFIITDSAGTTLNEQSVTVIAADAEADADTAGVPYLVAAYRLPDPAGLPEDAVLGVRMPNGGVLGTINVPVVIPSWALPFTEDFEGGFPAGWTKTGTAPWTVETPTNDCCIPIEEYTQTLNTSTGCERPDAGDDTFYPLSTVETPAIDCTGYASVSLSFDATIALQTELEVVGADVSGDNGATWTNLWSRAGGDDPIPTRTIVELDLSAVAVGQSQVKVRWTYTGGCCFGMAVDDVSITGAMAVPFTEESAAAGDLHVEHGHELMEFFLTVR